MAKLKKEKYDFLFITNYITLGINRETKKGFIYGDGFHQTLSLSTTYRYFNHLKKGFTIHIKKNKNNKLNYFKKYII